MKLFIAKLIWMFRFISGVLLWLYWTEIISMSAQSEFILIILDLAGLKILLKYPDIYQSFALW